MRPPSSFLPCCGLPCVCLLCLLRSFELAPERQTIHGWLRNSIYLYVDVCMHIYIYNMFSYIYIYLENATRWGHVAQCVISILPVDVFWIYLLTSTSLANLSGTVMVVAAARVTLPYSRTAWREEDQEQSLKLPKKPAKGS